MFVNFSVLRWTTTISALCHFNSRSKECIHDLSIIKMWSRNISLSLSLALGGGQQHTNGMLMIIQHMWSPLCTDLPLFWEYGKDVKHICHTWNVVCAFKYCMFHTCHIRGRCYPTHVQGVCCMFLPSINSIHTPWDSSYDGRSEILTLPSTGYDTCMEIFPKAHGIWSLSSQLYTSNSCYFLVNSSALCEHIQPLCCLPINITCWYCHTGNFWNVPHKELSFPSTFSNLHQCGPYIWCL